VTGHAYDQPGFSTLTTLVDTGTGETLTDLEQFTIFRDGKSFKEQDFNFWGVTFTQDSKSFYATLASKGKTYLIKGTIAQREAGVLRENVECPSLSPDNKWIVFKKRVDNASGKWRLCLLNTRTLEDKPLAETRSVDDQPEWLDGERILYSLPESAMVSSARMNVWISNITRSESPAVLITDAYSPAVIH
jgi:Tol biopolymer transport system component